MIATLPSRLLASICSRLPPPASEEGLTLVEVLIATIVLAVGIVGTFGMLNTATKTSAQTHDREGAVSLAREILEDARTIPFAQLSPSSVEAKLQEMNGLENLTPGEGWHIARGESKTQKGATYTVEVSECAIDEPKNGLALTSEVESEASTYCEAHKGNEEWQAGDAVDTTPIDFKRVTARVSWTATGRSPYVQQVALIGAAGEPTSLNATELKLAPPKASYGEVLFKESTLAKPVVEGDVAELTFSVCAPTSATGVLWSLEGVLEGSATKLEAGCKEEEGKELETGGKVERNTWTFKWKIEGLSDGTYQISAQATTTKGVLGAPVTIPVTLLRATPAAPKGVKGGFNEVYVGGVKTRVVELEWAANSERNVIGYQVYGPKGEAVCPSNVEEVVFSLSCKEVPTSYEPESGLTYKIVALYQNIEKKVAQGEAAEFTLEYPLPTAPGPPRNLKSKDFEGTVKLTWEPPAEGEVAFYRIYRGAAGEACPMNYTSRYGIASAVAEPSFTDTNTTTTHSYCVTAVGFTMIESSFAGPVTD
jgi:Tfp pilus assembly protein PilV